MAASECSVESWPASRQCTRIVVTKGPDAYGRYDLTLFWWQGNRRRAQCFGAVDLSHYIREATKFGGHAEILTTSDMKSKLA